MSLNINCKTCWESFEIQDIPNIVHENEAQPARKDQHAFDMVCLAKTAATQMRVRRELIGQGLVTQANLVSPLKCPLCAKKIETLNSISFRELALFQCAVLSNDGAFWLFDAEGNPDLNWLFRQGPRLPQYFRGDALKTLARAESNCRHFINEILQTGPISEQDRSEAIQEAAQRDREDTVRSLLASGPISDASRGEALKHFASRRDTKLILRSLLQHGPIADVDFNDALERAKPFARRLPVPGGDCLTYVIFKFGPDVLNLFRPGYDVLIEHYYDKKIDALKSKVSSLAAKTAAVLKGSFEILRRPFSVLRRLRNN